MDILGAISASIDLAEFIIKQIQKFVESSKQLRSIADGVSFLRRILGHFEKTLNPPAGESSPAVQLTGEGTSHGLEAVQRCHAVLEKIVKDVLGGDASRRANIDLRDRVRWLWKDGTARELQTMLREAKEDLLLSNSVNQLALAQKSSLVDQEKLDYLTVMTSLLLKQREASDNRGYAPTQNPPVQGDVLVINPKVPSKPDGSRRLGSMNSPTPIRTSTIREGSILKVQRDFFPPDTLKSHNVRWVNDPFDHDFLNIHVHNQYAAAVLEELMQRRDYEKRAESMGIRKKYEKSDDEKRRREKEARRKSEREEERRREEIRRESENNDDRLRREREEARRKYEREKENLRQEIDNKYERDDEWKSRREREEERIRRLEMEEEKIRRLEMDEARMKYEREYDESRRQRSRLRDGEYSIGSTGEAGPDLEDDWGPEDDEVANKLVSLWTLSPSIQDQERKLATTSSKEEAAVKPSGNKECDTKFRKGDSMIACYTCGTADDIVFCEDCFDPKHHRGHVTEVRKSKGTDSYCDCGHEGSVRRPMTCNIHGTTEP